MPEGPRVVFVSSHAQIGGAEIFLETLLRRLPSARVAGVVSLQRGPFLERIADLRPVVVHTTGRRTDIARSVFRLRRALRALRPDVVHANGVKAALMSGLAMLGTGTPVLWAKHDFFWDGVLARFIASLCARVVAVSEAATSTFSGRPRRKVHVVHGAVAPGTIPEEPRRLLEEATGRELVGVRTLGLIGRIHPVKGHAEIIRALPAVRAEQPTAVCLFIGPDDPSVPSYRPQLVALAHELGIEDAIWWLGHRDDVRSLMHGLDVGVIPSVPLGRSGREAFPLVALEYMQAGTPVVAYADGGIPESLADCGLLVPPGDRAALAAAITEVLADAQLRERVASCGRARVASEFTPEKMTRSFDDHYREVERR